MSRAAALIKVNDWSRDQVTYGDTIISYRIRQSDTISKRVLIHVYPDAGVEVEAPSTTAKKDIRSAVLKRAAWVNKQLKSIEQRHEHVLPRLYVSGESHFYLGRRYMLKLINVSKVAETVKLSKGRIEIRTKNRSPLHVQKLLDQWYLNRAVEKMKEIHK